MAHIAVRQQANGTKSYRVKWRDPDGAFRERTFRTKKEAEAYAATVTADMVRGNYVDDRLGRLTFREVAEEWLLTRTRAKPRTIAEYRRLLDKRVLPEFGNRKIGTLRKVDSARYVKKLADEGLSANTIARVYGLYKSVLLYALGENYLSNPSVVKVDLPDDHSLNRDEFEPRFLTVRELDRLADAAKVFHPDYRLLVLFLGLTGLRVGECAALTVGDVVEYLDGRVEVKVSKTAQYVRGAGMVTTAPKTRTSNRTVTLPPTLAQEMREYLARHPAAPNADTRPSKDAPLWCGRKTGGSYVADWAPTPSGSKHRAPAPGYRPLNPDVPWEPSTWGKSVWSRAIALANKEGVDKGEPPIAALRLHDLRHTAASLMLASGMNMHEVATALGHANSSITAKVYAHLLPSEVVRSSERYDAWMADERTRAQEAAERVTVLRRA